MKRSLLPTLLLVLLLIPGTFLRGQESISLDQAVRSGRCGERMEEAIRVTVRNGSGAPLEGAAVAFSLVSVPGQAEGAGLSHTLVRTDSLGRAETWLTLGSKPGEYMVSCRIRDSFPDNEAVFSASARKKNWVYMLVIGLFGGLGLFLFGMHTMSEGMQQSAGERMRSILGIVTRNRIVGVGVGTLVTTIIQSSSATSVMLVSFVNAKLVRFRQTIPVLLGAAIGTTITAQIIAFKITEYSLVMVAAGFFLQSFARREQLKSVGTSLFGIGVLFFGMQIMSESMSPLREWTPLIDLLLHLEHPILGILVGALFTALIQSSSAFVGIMIVLASQGLISLEAAIPMLLGSNLGTTVTALLSSMNSDREAKKVAFSFLIIKFISVLIFASWTTRLGMIMKDFTPEASLQRLIANSHTFINLVLTLVVLPVSPQVAKLVDLILGRAKEEEKPQISTLYLDRSMISTPSLALNLAKQEIMRMGTISSEMFDLILPAFLEKNHESLNAIYMHEKEVDFLRDAIKDYMVGVNREMVSSKRVNESFQMLYSMNEYEKIADIVSESLANQAEKWIAKEYVFSKVGSQELRAYHEKVQKQLKRALVVFDETNLQKAARMKAKHKEYRNLSHDFEKQHYARIVEGIQESIDSSKTHLEILVLFSTIDSHATNIARIALDWEKQLSLS